ncbi:MAG: ABC transporter substrate-binding protein [Micromonosporaceae bacterium]
MRLRKRGSTPLAAVTTLALAASLSACTANTGEDAAGGDLRNRSSVIATDPKDSLGPAPAVTGAQEGGTVTIIRETDYTHLDPQQTYTVSGWALGQLMYRTLTAFKEDGKGGMKLVGDLATGPGKDVNDDCKTWKFTIKDNVRFETGDKITAADVAYGIGRSFSPTFDDGATYIQEWLAGDSDFSSVWAGPYKTKEDVPPNLDVKGQDLTFNFDEPHCDMPFAGAMTTTVPVPKDQDSESDYDTKIVSSGPYKMVEYKRDTRIVLERNDEWDPKSDAIRHQYPESFEVEIGPDMNAATERVIADSGNDKFAVAQDGVPQELTNAVLDDTDLKDRTLQAGTALVWYLRINNQRVTDVDTRRAIAYALDKENILRTAGGDAEGKITHTILTPTTIGYEEYKNPYQAPPTGDAKKAKALLDGKKPKLVMLHRTTDPYPQQASVVKESLEKAGFKVTLQSIDDTQHNTETKEKDNPYDLYMSSWIGDWPSGASTVQPLFDGETISASGNNNTSYLNDPEINSEIDRISKLDAEKAGPEWMKLDETIMKEHCPNVPLYSVKHFSVHGSGVGGIFVSDFLGQQAYYNVFAKG